MDITACPTPFFVTVHVAVSDAISEIFDIRAEDEDGDTYTLWNVDISKRDVTFSIADMD